GGPRVGGLVWPGISCASKQWSPRLEPQEADCGQELLSVYAEPQRDSSRNDVQLRAVHQAQRRHEVWRLR
ncbi:unnamed protein product, partial [Ectocarpus sp. 12 AP-2014]